MVEITATAKEKFEVTLKGLTNDPQKCIRIIPSSSVPHQLDLVLDSEREGDVIIIGKSGCKVLLIGVDIIGDLEGKTVDYHETTPEIGFVVTEPDP